VGVFFVVPRRCVAVYDAGASFGEVALIHNQPRPNSMYVLEDAILLTVSKAQYQSVLLTLQNEKFQRRAVRAYPRVV